MKKRICAMILSLTLISSLVYSASAAKVDLAEVEASRDIGVVAADYPDVGTDLDPETPLPSAYSNQESATPVRTQRFNTCWAYSSTAVLEIAAAKAGIYDGHLSPMHMNYWATAQANGNGWQRDYTAAGYPYIAMGYLTSFSGAVKEDDFPSSGEIEDYDAFGKDLAPYVGVDSLIYLNANDRDTVKTAIYRYGAAVGNFHYVFSYLNSDNSAYFCDEPGLLTTQLRGHAVAIVGWDDDYSRENFGSQYTVTNETDGTESIIEEHRPENNGAWLCKNSWGADWSNLGGYFWISYEDLYLFEDRFGPSYSVIGAVQYAENEKLYQNEIYGATCEFNYLSASHTKRVDANQKLTYVNVFDFRNAYNELDKIIFETTSIGSDYDLFYIPVDKNGVPSKDEEQWTLLGSGTVDYQGYISADIDDFTVPVGKGGIGVTMKITENSPANDDVSIGVSEYLLVGTRYVYLPDTNVGDSYIIGYTSDAEELMSFYKKYLNDDIGGTFVIKAKTNKVDVMGDVDYDDTLTILDVTKIQRKIAGLEDFDDEQQRRADYDADSLVTILDCTKIQRVLADIEQPLYPVY